MFCPDITVTADQELNVITYLLFLNYPPLYPLS